MALEDTAVELGAQDGELGAVVDALDGHRGPGLHGAHTAAVGLRDREDVGEVDLALSVVLAEAPERGAQHRGVEHVHRRVDLADLALLVRRVLVLDDPGDVTVGVAQDPAVAGRVVDDGREDRHGVLAGGVLREQVGERLGVDQRGVAREDDDGTVDAERAGGAGLELARRGRGRLDGGVERRERALDGAARAGDLVLVDDERAGDAGESLGRDGLALVPDDDGDPLGVERGRRGEGVAEDGAPGEGVEDLGGGGAHPRALACSQDDDGGGTCIAHSGGHMDSGRVGSGCRTHRIGLVPRHSTVAPPLPARTIGSALRIRT